MRLAPVVALLIAASASSNDREARRSGWRLDPVAAQVGTLRLTPEGEKKRAAYDFQKDDPGLSMQTCQLHPGHAYTFTTDRGPATAGSCGSEL